MPPVVLQEPTIPTWMIKPRHYHPQLLQMMSEAVQGPLNCTITSFGSMTVQATNRRDSRSLWEFMQNMKLGHQIRI